MSTQTQRIRAASDAFPEAVFECCKLPAIAVMDYMKYSGSNVEGSPRINRVCTKCFTHWFGHSGHLKKYRRQEWDALMGLAFAPDSVAATRNGIVEAAVSFVRVRENYHHGHGDDDDAAYERLKGLVGRYEPSAIIVESIATEEGSTPCPT